MYTPEVLQSLVELVYETMFDPAQWTVLLESLADAMKGTLPILFLHDVHNHSGLFAISVGYDSAVLRAYQEHLAERNVWVRSGIRLLEPGRVRTSHMMCSRSTLLHSQWWSDFCRPLGVSQGIGTTIFKEGTTTYNVSVLAGDRRADYGHEDIELLHSLVPHLQRALKMNMHVAESDLRQYGLLDALDKLRVGILLVHGNGSVTFMNQSAAQLVKARDGLVVDRTGLRALRSDETTQLRALIGGAAATSAGQSLHPGGTMTVRRAGDRRPLEIVVSPARTERAPSFFAKPVAIVYVIDPDRQPQRTETVMIQLYRLTPTEARVAALVVRGRSIPQVAASLGLSRNTVKTHLKAIFAKTNTRRQAELIRLLAGGVEPPSASFEN